MNENILNIKTPALEIAGKRASRYDLTNHGLTNLKTIYWNLSTELLYEEAIFRGEAQLAKWGSLVVNPGRLTERTGVEKFVVSENDSKQNIWWGEYNRPFTEDKFNTVYQRMLGSLQGRDMYVQDCFGGNDPDSRLPIRIITEYAWHSLFARNMLIKDDAHFQSFVPEFTILSIPSFFPIPAIDGSLARQFILINFDQKLCLIGNAGYGGEIKKAVFAILNYLLPLKGILPLRCSANIGDDDNTALIIGPTGSGKSSLIVDPSRQLIGDDEHGWHDEGIFNLERGRYTREISPDTKIAFGAIMEGIVCDPLTRKWETDLDKETESNYIAAPLKHVNNLSKLNIAAHPKDIFILACDSTGVLPPIARLTAEQAIYYFISGYSSSINRPETGVDQEPTITFNPCCGARFMVHHPQKQVEMLYDKIKRYKVNCWLVNTGWTGGSYATGRRLKLEESKTIINCALSRSLDKVKYQTDPVFGFEIPQLCPELPDLILNPEKAWPDSDTYRDKQRQLAVLLIENIRKASSDYPDKILKAGPILAKQETQNI